MGRPEDLIDNLFELHGTTDDAQRAKLLSEVVTDDVQFHGVSAQFDGIDEFDAGFRNDVMGAALVRTSGVDEHDGWLRNTWQLVDEDGTPVTDEDGTVYGGLQVSEVTDDGRFRRIVPWLGVQPPTA